MKKNYFLAIALIAFSVNAQYEINFDDMSLGPVSPQSVYVEVWPGALDCNVVIDEAYSGDNSMYVGNNQLDDVVFLLDNKNSGVWTVGFYMYVYSGSTGFWNIQDNEIPGVQWNGQFFAGTTASGGSEGNITHDETGLTIPYPSDQWFEVRHEIDLNAMTMSAWIDGALFLDNVPYVGTGGAPANALGSINFYSIDTNNNYFVDDFIFVEGTLSTSDFSSNAFTVHPNPVKNNLNINSNEAVSKVAIYNVLGQKVHVSSPNAISPSVNMSTFKSGIYFVEVTIGNTTKTVKVVK
ncbi:MAG: T9SS type A sorting domain-containing protein [Flavobacteriaceae bacterium]|nr:T9SS type A sorting domain-containing protein [Flavobacteriaceae bacterium]